jgi:NhaA family Na+:H+ antiporter
MTPATAWIGRKTFLEVMTDFWDRIRDEREHEHQNQHGHEHEHEHEHGRVPVNLEQLRFLARESHSPLHRLEMGLHPWVAYAIMPIFALANAGVKLDPVALTSGVSIAVAMGLALGKPLGIFLSCFLAVRMGWTKLPRGVNWPIFLGGACLGGIGFTMALFLNALSFPVEEYPALEGAGKIGTLVGSALSAILGTLLLLVFTRTSRTESHS